nr:ferrous iron transport protein B [uncultured Dethiosulfovibrio sp.]
MSDRVVALAGQPNCGKSTIFNMLTGARQHVANYPGVTVDIKKGKYGHDGRSFEVVDLPGTYSLTSFSSEEMVARDFLLSREAGTVLDVVDCSNLRRSLYLTFQLLEMELPLVVVLNMADVASSRGVPVDSKAMSEVLGLPVIETVGNRNKGVKELKALISSMAKEGVADFRIDYGPLERSIDELSKAIEDLDGFSLPPRWAAIKLLESDQSVAEKLRLVGDKGQLVVEKASLLSQAFTASQDEDPRAHIGLCRHLRAEEVESLCIVDSGSTKIPWTDRIDSVVVHRVAGPIVLLGVIYGLYELAIVQGYKATEYLVPWLSRFESLVSSLLPPSGILIDPLARSLVLGVVTAVNSVLIYIPIFLILFACIALLEDIGYMPRMAFILDRLFRRFGLHGQSTLPLILGGVFVGGCAVPGVMATRVIADEKARLGTILIVPLMNCMAKIPLYTLLISVFFAGHGGAMMIFISTITIIIALGVAKVLSLTVLKGKESAPFVMELPSYHIPTFRGVITRSVERTWLFVKKVGTVVVAVAVLVFFLINYPPLSEGEMDQYSSRMDGIVASFREAISKTPYAKVLGTDEGLERMIGYMEQHKKARMSGSSRENLDKKFESLDQELFPLVASSRSREPEIRSVNRAFGLFRRDRAFLLKEMADARTNGSWLGRAGKVLVPFTKYAGFDWKVNVALLSSLAAKESSVATLGMIYRPVDSEHTTLEEGIKQDGGFSPLHALALMVFMALYPPCVATLIMVKVESGSWKWALLSLFYPIVLGIVCASLIFTGGQALGLSGFSATWVFYGLALMITLFLGTIDPSPSKEDTV